MAEYDLSKSVKEGKFNKAGDNSQLGVISLILGIASFVLMYIISIFAIIPAVVSIILGCMTLKRGDKYGLVGMILGSITLVLIIIVVIEIIYVYTIGETS